MLKEICEGESLGWFDFPAVVHHLFGKPTIYQFGFKELPELPRQTPSQKCQILGGFPDVNTLDLFNAYFGWVSYLFVEG